MNNKNLRQYIFIVILISLGISILAHFDAVLKLILENGDHRMFDRDHDTIGTLLSEVIITFMVTMAAFIVNYYILNPFNSSRSNNFLTILLAITVTFFAVYLLNAGLFELRNGLRRNMHHDNFSSFYMFRDFFITIVIIGSVLIIRVVNERQAIRMENEMLKRESLQSQYESLKNQLSPHFLFNSLAALKALINESPENAQLYINHLSVVLRYTLQSNENRMVHLSDEMDIVQSYLFLLQMRFNSNLKVETSINPEYNHLQLPPLSIQTLVENAIKHNEISRRSPLIINIKSTENNSIVVSNIIQQKISLEKGTGIGLSNLNRQYQLLCGREIDISNRNNEFRVEIPLL